MDPEQQRKVSEFCSVTGAQPERAEFFLQASNWDTSLAVATFYENGGEGSPVDDDIEDVTPTNPAEVPTLDTQAQPPTRNQPSSRIQTFSGLRGADDSSESDEEGQAYYAGGSRESGQQILGPSKKKKDHGKIVSDIFKAAREAGAEQVEESSERKAGTSRQAFGGAGYRLGESESEPSQMVQGARSTRRQKLEYKIRLWKNGFTVNDDPIRPYDDPKNRAFLQSIQKGECPSELASQAMQNGGEADCKIEDHRDEDWAPPKQPRYQAFKGQGQTLGGDQAGSSSVSVVASSGGPIQVNNSEPTTNIQVRLADGSRLIVKLNHTHTVGDLRRHIVNERPQYAAIPFTLSAAFPPKPLTDDSQSVKSADLLNAAVNQKL